MGWLCALGGVAAGCQSAAERGCLARGGRWAGPAGLGATACSMPTSDAGRSCRDGVECEGDCVVGDETARGVSAKGRCSAESSSLGRCVNLVEAGAARGVVCLE